MTLTELTQVVNFISKSEPYQNEKVGFAVTLSDIESLGYKIHLFHINTDRKPLSFSYIEEYSILDRQFIPTVCTIVRFDNDQTEFQIF